MKIRPIRKFQENRPIRKFHENLSHKKISWKSVPYENFMKIRPIRKFHENPSLTKVSWKSVPYENFMKIHPHAKISWKSVQWGPSCFSRKDRQTWRSLIVAFPKICEIVLNMNFVELHKPRRYQIENHELVCSKVTNFASVKIFFCCTGHWSGGLYFFLSWLHCTAVIALYSGYYTVSLTFEGKAEWQTFP